MDGVVYADLLDCLTANERLYRCGDGLQGAGAHGVAGGFGRALRPY